MLQLLLKVIKVFSININFILHVGYFNSLKPIDRYIEVLVNTGKL